MLKGDLAMKDNKKVELADDLLDAVSGGLNENTTTWVGKYFQSKFTA